MKVEIEAVENGFILREIKERNDEGFPVAFVAEIDGDCDEETAQKNKALAVVRLVYQTMNSLGYSTSKHNHFNYRCIVVDHEGNEVM